jgi:hypothetical protein
MDELFASGLKLAYLSSYSTIFESVDKTYALKVQRNGVICPSYEDCIDWVHYQYNISFLLPDDFFEENVALGDYLGQNSKPFLCGITDGLFRTSGLTMIMLHGDPLMRRVTEIIDRVVAAGKYNSWNSLRMHSIKLRSRTIVIVYPLDGYYSFNLYHMQPAFYLLFIGWCLSALCFVVEMLYNGILIKIN